MKRYEPGKGNLVRSSRLLKKVIQTLVAAALLLWLVANTEWKEIWWRVSSLRWEGVAISLVLLLTAHTIYVLRWFFLLKPATVSYPNLLVCYGTGLFSNNFMPVSLGGDGVRVLLLSKRVPSVQAVFSVVLDRLVGLLALTGLAGLGFWVGIPDRLLATLTGKVVSPHVPLFWWEGVGLLLIVLVILGFRWKLWLIDWVFKKVGDLLRIWKVPKWGLKKWITKVVIGFLLSLLGHFCLVLMTWMIFWSIRTPLPISASIWLVVIGNLSLLLPVTLNGAGVVEGVYVLVLGAYAFPGAVGLLGALVKRTLGFLVSLVGGGLAMKADFFKTGRQP